MKRLFSMILCLAMLVGVFALPMSVVAVSDVETPTDVPKIIITTDKTITRDEYVTSTIKIIDEDGGSYETIIDEEAKVKIRGNSTSSAYKKPYNIKFSSKQNVLGMGKNKKWCILANCYDKTLLRNMTVFDFAEMAGVPYTPNYRVVDVYVNGVYGGCYLITDAIEVGSTRVDIDVDDNEFLLELDKNPEDEDSQYFYSSRYGIKFAINEPEKEDLTDDQFQYVQDLVTVAENALYSKNFDTISKYFDIESMVNFYVTLEFFKNIDVNTSSTRFHIKDGKIYGGPVWDFDLSSGNGDDDYYGSYNKNTDNDIKYNKSYEDLWATNVPWFYRLMKTDEFQALVKERYLELQDEIVNLYTDNLNGVNKIDSYISTYEGTINRNHNEAGWRVDVVHHASMQLERDPDKTYEENVAFYRNWLQKRNEWLLNYWGLSSEVTAKSENYSKLNGYFVENVKIGTTASQLLSDYKNAKLVYNGKELKNNDLVRNGACVTVGGANYVMYIKGDVYADGKISAMDYLMVKRAVMGSIILDDTQKIAAKINTNDRVDAVDYTLIKRHVIGTYVIQ